MLNLKKNESALTDKQKKIISIAVIIALIVFSAAVAWFVGKPMIKLVFSKGAFSEWVDSHGIWSRFIFIGMVIFQVVIALVPGEPLEIGAGYAFGAVEGTILVVVGITLGSVMVLGLVRKFGVKLVEVFFDIEKIKKLKFLQDEKRLDFITAVVFFLPGTPKDLLTYAVGLTDIKFSRFLLIVSVARFPSVITSTIGGSALGMANYKFAIIVFALTAVISLAGIAIYNYICRKKGKNE